MYIKSIKKGSQNIAIAGGTKFDFYLQMNLSNSTVISKLATQSQMSQSFTAMTDNTSTIKLFKASGYNGGYWKCYSFKISIDDTYVRNFVPVKRKSDGIFGLYDTVSNAFFTNVGSGSFTGA